MKKMIEKVFKSGKIRAERKTTQPYDGQLKAQIIGQYLKGDKSFAMLGRKYNINPGVISRWVRVVKNGRTGKAQAKKITKFTAMSKKVNKTLEDLQQENKLLRRQLEEEQLKSLVYQKVIEIAERDYKLDIVKKYAARRPKRSGK